MKRLLSIKSTIIFACFFAFLSCVSAKKSTETTQQELPKVTKYKKPTASFIEKIKSTAGCRNNPRCRYNFYYTFDQIDFQDFEPVTMENILTDYRGIFELGEEDEMRVKKVNVQPKGTNFYLQYYKGLPVHKTKDNARKQCFVGLYSKNDTLIRAVANIQKGIDIQIKPLISDGEAFNIAENTIDLGKPEYKAHLSYNFFSHEKEEEVDDYFKKWIKKPIGALLVLDGELNYKYEFWVYGHHDFGDFHRVFVNAITGKTTYYPPMNNNNIAK